MSTLAEETAELLEDPEEEEEDPWSGYNSGSFCEHWGHPDTCNYVCEDCEHECSDHGVLGRGCKMRDCECSAFKN